VTLADLIRVGSDLGVAAVVLVWLVKGVLPELRGMRLELRAIEKHLAGAGQVRAHLVGEVHEAKEGVDFLVSQAQRANGRTTSPG